MSTLLKQAQAGTIESTDILIMLSPAAEGAGLSVELASPVLKQYGRHIKSMICNILQEEGIQDAQVHATDNGALDYTIDARVRTAIARALA